MFKTLKTIWFDIVILAIVLHFSLKLFLFLAFLYLLWRIDYNRRVTRVLSFWNEVRMAALLKKAKVTDKEILRITKKAETAMGKEAWDDLEDDFQSIRNPDYKIKKKHWE